MLRVSSGRNTLPVLPTAKATRTNKAIGFISHSAREQRIKSTIICMCIIVVKIAKKLCGLVHIVYYFVKRLEHNIRNQEKKMIITTGHISQSFGRTISAYMTNHNVLCT